VIFFFLAEPPLTIARPALGQAYFGQTPVVEISASGNFLSGLEDWQTLIAAFVGFLAATIISYKLNRKRDQALLNDEIRAMRWALYGEIIVLRVKIADLARAVAGFEFVHRGEELNEQFALDFLPPDPQIYPKLANRFGLIPAEEFFAIVRFYADYAEAKDSLPRIIRREGVRYASTGVLRPAKRAVADIEATLRAIESDAGFATAESPDLGHTEDIIEQFDDLQQQA